MSSGVGHFRSGANVDSLGQTPLYSTKNSSYKSPDSSIFTLVLEQPAQLGIIQIRHILVLPSTLVLDVKQSLGHQAIVIDIEMAGRT